MAGLTAFCAEKGIKAGHLTGLGSARETVLAYYNLDTKEYEGTPINERVEVIGVVGNVAVKNGSEVVVHAHGTIADQGLVPKAGHIQKMVVSATVEVSLTALQGEVNRGFDEDTGLTLMR